MEAAVISARPVIWVLWRPIPSRCRRSPLGHVCPGTELIDPAPASAISQAVAAGKELPRFVPAEPRGRASAYARTQWGGRSAKRARAASFSGPSGIFRRHQPVRINAGFCCKAATSSGSRWRFPACPYRARSWSSRFLSTARWTSALAPLLARRRRRLFLRDAAGVAARAKGAELVLCPAIAGSPMMPVPGCWQRRRDCRMPLAKRRARFLVGLSRGQILIALRNVLLMLRRIGLLVELMLRRLYPRR